MSAVAAASVATAAVAATAAIAAAAAVAVAAVAVAAADAPLRARLAVVLAPFGAPQPAGAADDGSGQAQLGPARTARPVVGRAGRRRVLAGRVVPRRRRRVLPYGGHVCEPALGVR